MNRNILTTVAAVLCFLVQAVTAAGLENKGASHLASGDIFRFTNTWTIHLTFTPEQ